MEDNYIYFFITFLIVTLVGVAKYYHGKAEKAEKSQIILTAEGIQHSVETLSNTVGRLAEDTAKANERGERRMAMLEHRVTVVETTIATKGV
jgi:hypothetical protein